MISIVCAAVILTCPVVEIENETLYNITPNSVNTYKPLNDRDLSIMLIAQIKCETTCPKKCLTKFIKRAKNSYWAICGDTDEKGKN